MKYKVGDKVKIKSIEWYNANKDSDEVVPCMDGYLFMEDMSEFCNKTAEIHKVYPDCYIIDIDKGRHNWTDDMLESIYTYLIGYQGPTSLYRDFITLNHPITKKDILNLEKSTAHAVVVVSPLNL